MTAVRSVARCLRRLSLAGAAGTPADAAQRVVLMYHGVSETAAFNCVTTEQLRTQLEWVRRRYYVVRVTGLIQAVMRGWTTQQPLLALTFDDAYENFFTNAYPLLRELNLPAGVAIPSGHVGGINQWDVEQGYPVLRLMTWRQLRELDPHLIEFGSHSVTHRSFGRLSEAEIRDEIFASTGTIQQELSCPVPWFAFPYGKRADIHPAAERVLEETGFAGGCSTKWGRFNRAADRYTLKRIDVWPDDTLEEFQAKLEGNYDWLGPKEALAFWARRLTGVGTRR